MKKPLFSFSLGPTRLTWDVCWLVTAPLGLWLIASVYISLFGGNLRPGETWLLAISIGACTLISLVAHTFAHLFAARICKGEMPSFLPLYPIGDASQVWSPARTPGEGFLIAVSGPLCSGIMAGGAFLVWNMQLAPYLSLIMLFLVFFNGGVALVNLMPAFPLDGGRLLGAICWRLLEQPAAAAVWPKKGGKAISFLLTLWGIFLLIQHTRYSLWAGGTTLALAVLVLYPLYRHRPMGLHPSAPIKKTRGLRVYLRVSLAYFLIASLLAITLALVPTNNGLKHPGVSQATAPMVQLPRENRHPIAGSFLITTVALQTPILAGQWLYSMWNPAAELVPPERIVPPDTTLQERAQRGYSILEVSKTKAVAVGLTRAGYDVKVSGEGVRIVSLMNNSPSLGILKPGDVIVGIDNQPVLTLPELTTQLALKHPSEQVELQIKGERGREVVAVNLLSPLERGAHPRLGIAIEQAGYDYTFPFPVAVVPQKITGGPSAGLMLALTTYNLVTPEDLTGGRIIAGTGTINLDGSVGPVGSVRQKVAGAELAGAEYFLVPPQHYQEARAAARRIEVIQAGTIEETINFLKSLPPDLSKISAESKGTSIP